MRRIRLVVSDLDGTLLSRSGRLGGQTRETLAEVRRRGVHFSIATERLFHHALPIAAELHLSDPLICCDGALTRNVCGEPIERELFLPPETAQEAFAQLFFYADSIFLFGRDVIYASPEADEAEVAPWGSRVIRFDPRAELPDNLQAILAFGQRDLLGQAARLLHEAIPGISATIAEGMRQGSAPLLVRAKGADKGAALSALRARLSLRPDEVMVFGGCGGDLPMFREAGCSVAPRNAPAAVRRAASYVSAYTSDEEFVARELERAIL
ncbi:MAG: HAD hydrolase family protein [Patescibacteria group bacterium]